MICQYQLSILFNSMTYEVKNSKRIQGTPKKKSKQEGGGKMVSKPLLQSAKQEGIMV